MDVQRFARLNPRFDPSRALLVLELDHGKANEMGEAELDAFDALCDALEVDDIARCLCTTSRRTSARGTPIFIAGANVTERADWPSDRVAAHVERQREVMARLRRLPLFHIVLSTGVTLGWGAEYVLAADYALATKQARFGLPETGLGIVPGAGGTAHLAMVVGVAHALRLGCTGEVIDADEAVRIGLVAEGVPDIATGMARVDRLAEQLKTRSPTAVSAFKSAVQRGLGESEKTRLALERSAYAHMLQTGEAAIGRAHFSAVRAGETPPYGPRKPLL